MTLATLAQISPFLQKGQSGFGVNVGAEKGLGFNGLFMELGTSVKGVLDVELSHYNLEFDQDELFLLSDDAKAKYYELALTWWFLRSQPSSAIDINVGVRPTFELSDYRNFKYPTDTGTGVVEYEELYNAAIGLRSNVVFHLPENWLIQPFFNIEYEIGDEKESVSQTDNYNFEKGMISSLGITLAKQFEKQQSLYVSLRQYSNTYGIGDYFDVAIGYVFPW
jgi:hypothetical protein